MLMGILEGVLVDVPVKVLLGIIIFVGVIVDVLLGIAVMVIVVVGRDVFVGRFVGRPPTIKVA